MINKNKHFDEHIEVELAIFHIGKLTCALKSLEIQEIIRVDNITPVYEAEECIKGVINLRGNIVTIIDMGVKFSFGALKTDKNSRIIIVRMKDEMVGLLVDMVDDILLADVTNIDPPSSNVKGLSGAFFTGIYKMEHSLVSILNVDEILNIEKK